MAELLTDDPERAADCLAAGGLAVLPTETVYGLGADAEQPGAVGRIFTVKGRPAGHPLIVHLPAAEGRGVPVVEEPELVSRLNRVAHVALSQKPVEPVGKEREDVNLQ